MSSIRIAYSSEKTFCLLVMLLIIGMMCGTRPTSARIEGITVTTFDDEYDTNPGACSLREAIVAINMGSAFGGCPTSSGNSTISLPAGVYTLSIPGDSEDSSATGDLDIMSGLTISGEGANTTVITATSTFTDRVFHIQSTAVVTISGVTIGGGNTGGVGGGIYNENGRLTLSTSRLVGNEAFIDGGAIHTGYDGVTVVISATIDNNYAWFSGGGIRCNGGTLEILDSTISGNQASSGGGIDNFTGAVTVTNSTISNNYANGGGAIAIKSGSLTLLNDTIYNNQATMTEGGGGIRRLGTDETIYIQNTILAWNIDGSGEAPDCSGYVVSQGYNLVGNVAGCGGFISSDQIGTSTNPIDPLLGPLQDNGGPTLTHALLARSPAINKGSNGNCPSTDQRGVVRPQGGICDIGAYELALAHSVFLPLVWNNR